MLDFEISLQNQLENKKFLEKFLPSKNNFDPSEMLKRCYWVCYGPYRNNMSEVRAVIVS